MIDTDFISEINTLSEQNIELCYHCHKCTAGCPVVEEMQYGPDRILRMVQMGEQDALYTSHDIWLCASCETCGTRCPNQIDIARVMDALREKALLSGKRIAEPDAVKFHRLFLYLVQNMGRMHEVSLLAAYKIWSRNLLADMDSGAVMFVKGKVPLIPKPIRRRTEIKQIFAASEKAHSQEEQHSA